MVKKLITILFSTIMVLVGCTKGDQLTDGTGGTDKEGGERTETQEQKIECTALNNDIISLKSLIAELEKGEYITGVESQIKESVIIGSEISFSDGAKCLFHKKYNDKYTNPVIGVKTEMDKYYWTLDGAWLRDNGGNKMLASSSYLPVMKYDNDSWYVSTDSGTSWSQLDKAREGISKPIVKSIEKERYIYTVILYDDTKIVSKNYPELQLTFPELGETILFPKHNVAIKYSLVGAVAKTTVSCELPEDCVKNGWTVNVLAGNDTEGIITISAGITVTDAKIPVIATNNEGQNASATISIIGGIIEIEQDCYSFNPEGGFVTIPIRTNADYSISLLDDAKTWISFESTKATVRTDQVVFTVAANTGFDARYADVKILDKAGTELKHFQIKQAGVSLQLSPDYLNASYETSQYSIRLKANCDWKVVVPSEWIAVSPSAGKGSEVEQTITISVLGNSSIESRQCSLEFQYGEEKRWLVVTQEGAYITLQISFENKTKTSFSAGFITLQDGDQINVNEELLTLNNGNNGVYSITVPKNKNGYFIGYPALAVKKTGDSDTAVDFQVNYSDKGFDSSFGYACAFTPYGGETSVGLNILCSALQIKLKNYGSGKTLKLSFGKTCSGIWKYSYFKSNNSVSTGVYASGNGDAVYADVQNDGSCYFFLPDELTVKDFSFELFDNSANSLWSSTKQLTSEKDLKRAQITVLSLDCGLSK